MPKPTVAPEVMLQQAAQRAQQRLCEHIERFAAAYIKLTKIKPEEAVLCHRFDPDGTQRIWFEKKAYKELDLPLIARMMDAAGVEFVKRDGSIQCGTDYLREAEKIRQYIGTL